MKISNEEREQLKMALKVIVANGTVSDEIAKRTGHTGGRGSYDCLLKSHCASVVFDTIIKLDTDA